MSIERIYAHADLLGYEGVEIHLLHRECGDATHKWRARVGTPGQMGRHLCEESGETPEKALEFVEKNLSMRIAARVKEHEEHAAKFRAALNGCAADPPKGAP